MSAAPARATAATEAAAAGEIVVLPPLADAPRSGAFVHEIRLVEGPASGGGGGTVIATLRWHAPADADEGVAQVLDVHVHPEHRRRGHGTRLLREAAAQAAAFYRARSSALRRLWLAVGHKRHIAARAFLTHCGYHHTATAKDLFRDEDLLVYTKSFD